MNSFLKKGLGLTVVFLILTLALSGCDVLQVPGLEQESYQQPEATSLSGSNLFPETEDGRVRVLIGFKNEVGQSEQNLVRGMGGKISRSFQIVNDKEVCS